MNQQKRSRDEWRRLVKAWRKSGLTGNDFAEANGFRYHTLRWWAQTLGREEKLAKITGVEFIELPKSPVPTSSATKPRSFELTLPNGCRLAFPSDIDPAQLNNVLTALEMRS